MPKVVSAGQATLRRIEGPESGEEVVVADWPGVLADALGAGVASGVPEGEGEAEVDGLGEAGELAGATHPALRSVSGKSAIEREARSQKPALPDSDRAPRSASPSGRAMISVAFDRSAETKASAWRSRARCAGSVAVGAGVGVGEALGEAVGALDWSDCASDCPDWVGSAPDWPASGEGEAEGDAEGLGVAVGCGPRGTSSGSMARVTPLAEARLRTAERSPWSWVALVEVQGITVLTREAETCAPESHTMIDRSLPEYSPEVAVTVVTRGPHSSASVRGSEDVGTRISKEVVAPRATSVSEEEAAWVASGSSSERAVVSAGTEIGVSFATNTSREMFASVVGESLWTVPEITSSFSSVIIRGDSELMDTESPESSETVPMTAGRDSPDCEVTVGSGAAPASFRPRPKGRAIAAHRTPAASARLVTAIPIQQVKGDAHDAALIGVGQLARHVA